MTGTGAPLGSERTPNPAKGVPLELKTDDSAEFCGRLLWEPDPEDVDWEIDPLETSIPFDDLSDTRSLATGDARDPAPLRHHTYRPAPIDVVRLRLRMNMTQMQFARRFGFPIGTLRHWEHRTRLPRGAALVLLNVIERDPGAVLRALKPKLP